MIGSDGRVRVMDFGLVRAEDLAASDDSGMDNEDIDDALAAELTQVGVVLGTPAYMAPEQHLGHSTDPRTDQFSFCVALWEALFDERPFFGKSRLALKMNVIQGRRQPVPSGRKVPTWLRRACDRGLEVEPARRFATMEDLLATLAEGRARARTRRIVVTLVPAAGVAVVGGVWVQQAGDDPCVLAETELGAVWSEDRRLLVRSALENVELGYAAATAERVDNSLTRYAEAWVGGYLDACQARYVRREQSAELFGQRLRCLEGRKRHFAALVEVLASPTESTLEHAVGAAAELPAVSSCADPEFVLADVSPPEDEAIAAEVEALRADIARLEALIDAADYESARSVAEETVARARALRYEPVLVEALNRSARLYDEKGELDSALSAAEEAYVVSNLASREAAAANHLRMATILTHRGDHDGALRESRRALSVTKAALGNNHGYVATSHWGIGTALHTKGKYDEALAEFRQALAVASQARGGDDLQLASIHTSIGGVLQSKNEYDEALQELRHALALLVESLGPEHPKVGVAHTNVGITLHTLGKLDEAHDEHLEALGILNRAFWGTHPNIGKARSNLAQVLLAKGEVQDALDEMHQGLAILSNTLGPDHTMVGSAHDNIGGALRKQGRYDDSIVQHRKALTILAASLGPDHPQVAAVYHNIGMSLRGKGEYDAALEQQRECLAIMIRALGPDDQRVAATHYQIAGTLWQEGSLDAALGEFRVAREVWTRASGPDHPNVARASATVAILAAELGREDQLREATERVEAVAAVRADDELVAAFAATTRLVATAAEDVSATSVEAIRETLATLRSHRRGFVAKQLEAWLTDHGVAL